MSVCVPGRSSRRPAFSCGMPAAYASGLGLPYFAVGNNLLNQLKRCDT